MTPTLAGRVQTRVVLGLVVGVPWTAVVTPVLGDAYGQTYRGLAAMVLLGVVWELGYHVVQQVRWDKDWPSLFGLLAFVNEGVVLWLVLPAVNVVHLVTTWLAMWLVAQGPMRVLHARWRFQGGELVAAGRPAAGGPDGERPRPAATRLPPAVRHSRSGPGELVAGVTCRHGHFCYPGARYCTLCGTALRQAAGSATGPRPPAGVLILPDGTPRPLNGGLDLVRGDQGRLDLVPCQENPRLARIRLLGWRPVVTSSLPAVEVELPGGSRLRAEADAPVPLVPGAELRIGDETVLFESLHHAGEPSPRPRRRSEPRGPVPAGHPAAAALAAAVAILAAATAVAALAAGIA